MHCGSALIRGRHSHAAPINARRARAASKTLRRIPANCARCGGNTGELVGVPTGAASDLFVIDVDSARHAEAEDWLERWSPHLPDTRQHATQSGGIHLLFRHRAGLRNSVGNLAVGIDTRGDGGYIIWWPFHTGLNAPHKLDRQLADLPDSIFEQLIERPRWPPLPSLPRQNRRPHTDARLKGLIARIRNAAVGERNSLLFWCANRISDMARSGELNSITVSQALHALANAAFQLGLDAREIEHTINSATKRRA
jgi:Bifunctional DNA primase/polymerase, N-terminal